MEYQYSLAAILGVVFHEAVRIYKVIRSNNQILPDIAELRYISWVIYILVLIIFCIVSVIASVQLASENIISSIWLGFSIPLGLKFTTSTSQSSESVDDHLSQTSTPFLMKIRDWIFEYSK